VTASLRTSHRAQTVRAAFDPLGEDAEIFVEQDIGVEHDRALGHLPRAVHFPQQILAATGEELMIRLQVRAVDQKPGLGLDLAVLQRRRFEIARLRRDGTFSPSHPAVEPHLEIALLLLEDRRSPSGVSSRCDSRRGKQHPLPTLPRQGEGSKEIFSISPSLGHDASCCCYEALPPDGGGLGWG
jgi:hypothetical protein